MNYILLSMHAGPFAVLEGSACQEVYWAKAEVPLTMKLCDLGPHFLTHTLRWAHLTRIPSNLKSIVLLALTESSHFTAPVTTDLDLLSGSQNKNSSYDHTQDSEPRTYGD